MNINTIPCDTIATEMYAGVALRTRSLGMTDGPRFAWIDAPTPAVRLTDAVSATPAGRNVGIDIHANSKQDRPPREDLR